MEIRGRAAEKRSAAARASAAACPGRPGRMDLDEHLHAIDQLIWPNLMILGGGVSKNADQFIPRLTVALPGGPGRSFATTQASSGRRSSAFGRHAGRPSGRTTPT